ncbi:MAG: DUF3047 domain-containing protein [Propionivibrio sp.]
MIAATVVFGALAAAKALGVDAAATAVTRFSTTSPDASLPDGWIHQTLPNVERPNRFDLVSENGQRVLRVVSDRSASTLAFALRADAAATPWLSWRWQISHAVDGSDFRSKAGDDYAARVYVLFDLPAERLGLGDRVKMSAAKLLHGTEIPAAALCYIWGNRQAVGEAGWNAYTDRLRMLVVDSGNEHAGQWRDVARNVAADFVAAFGAPVPPIVGIAVSADTDTTGEAVEARFGDFSLSPHP